MAHTPLIDPNHTIVLTQSVGQETGQLIALCIALNIERSIPLPKKSGPAILDCDEKPNPEPIYRELEKRLRKK